MQVDIGGQRLVAGMNLEDRLAAAQVGQVDHDLAIEPTRPQQGPVEHVGPIRRGQEDDPRVGLEAVHLDQQLIERLLALVVDSANVDAALPADGVELIDEDDARGLGLGLEEQVADSRGPDADEHLHEVAPAQDVERDSGLARHGAGQQGLTGSRWAKQEDPLGDLRPQGAVVFGMSQEVHDLSQLDLRLLAARHIVERDPGLLLGDQLRPALAEPEDGLPDRTDAPAIGRPRGASSPRSGAPRPTTIGKGGRAALP